MSTTTKPLVLVLGSTGNTGQSVVDGLLKSGNFVRCCLLFPFTIGPLTHAPLQLACRCPYQIRFPPEAARRGHADCGRGNPRRRPYGRPRETQGPSPRRRHPHQYCARCYNRTTEERLHRSKGSRRRACRPLRIHHPCRSIRPLHITTVNPPCIPRESPSTKRQNPSTSPKTSWTSA